MKFQKKIINFSPATKKKIADVLLSLSPVWVIIAILIACYRIFSLFPDSFSFGFPIACIILIAVCTCVVLLLRKRRTAEKNQEIEKNKNNALSIFRSLEPDYDTVLLIDGEKDSAFPFLIPSEKIDETDDFIRSGSSYTDLFSLLVRKFALDSEKEELLAEGSLQNIRSKLLLQPTIKIRFRSNRENQTRFMEMKFARIENSETLFTFSIAENDAPASAEYLQKSLSNDYLVLAVVDLEASQCKTVFRSANTHFIDKSVCDYSEAVSQYALSVDPDDQKEWNRFSSPDTIRAIPVDYDKREFRYKVKGEWRICTIRICERNSNIPSIAILTIASCESEMKEKEENNRRIVKLNETIVEKDKAIEEANNRFEAADKSKTGFLFQVSHDVRTPINAIRGLVSLAKKQVGDSEKVLNCLEKIRSSEEQLSSLLSDVLDLSRLENRQIESICKPLSLRNLCEDCSEYVSSRIGDRNLIFRTDFPKWKYPIVLGDELRLRQILTNLLKNALQYTSDGGMILFACNESVSQDEKTTRIEFRVADTGIGIDPNFIESVWEPFAREKGNETEGAGLGLTIVKRFTELMGGSVKVESKQGNGASFTVELPFTIDRSASPTAEKSERTSLMGLRILVVEDNEINREILGENLKVEGAEVVCTEDGQKALETFEASAPGHFNAILTDVSMPVKNGYELAQDIRSLSRSDAQSIPIIALSANAFEEDVRKSLASGMNAHLTKPIDMHLLKSKLFELMQ